MKQSDGRERKKAGKISLRDVADALGVSKTTVSMAINGNELVAKKTRLKVIEKANELGYVYNRGAAGLSTGETRTIGLAVHNLTNSYFTKVCASIETELSLHGRMPFLCNANESTERQSRFITALSEHNADGLILCPVIGTKIEHLRPLLKQRLPIVLIARDIEEANLDFVGNDDKLALRLATEHLIGLGHRRIALLGGTSRSTVGKQRRLGYLAAMEEAGLEVDPDLVVDCTAIPEGSVKAVKTVMAMRDPPTAIACNTDLIALGALSGLHELGLQPGKDVAVIGCDGIAEGERAYLRLSTVNVKKTDIGHTAAQILLRRLNEPDLELQRIIMKPELIIRGSCGTNSAPRKDQP